MSKAMTVKALAHLANVSIGTIDRVIHDRSGVSAETRSRVNKLIESCGYKPNALARQLSLGKVWVFTVLMPRSDQDSGYWGLCQEGIRAAAGNLAAFSAKVDLIEFDRYDPSAYQETLEGIVEKPGDCLLVAPVLPDALSAALRRLPPDFPYAFFDGYLPGLTPRFSIGQDAFAAGKLAGRLLSLLRPGVRPLVAIDPHPDDRHLGLRIAGFHSYFDTRGEGAGMAARPILVRSCPGFERESTCSTWLDRIFEEEPGLGGILVANASGHLAGDWLASRGLKNSVAVLSWDLVPANASALREGRLDCVISQRPVEQGRQGLERLYQAFVHGSPGGTVVVPSEIILRENLPRAEMRGTMREE